MSFFIPGKKVADFKRPNGSTLEIRYPRWEDIDALTTYINLLSAEDTYIYFSGEVVTKAEEMDYLTSVFKACESQNKVALVVSDDDVIVGCCEVNRKLVSKRRGLHVGTFGLTVARDYRGEHLGLALAKATISEARTAITGLRLITLTVHEPNQIARNLYSKLGFIESGRLPAGLVYKGEYIDNLSMVLKLV
jgi:RimJ/RimL family protein N-acetyltransferase